MSDEIFGGEFKLRLRAIRGLEKLRAVAELQKLYSDVEVMRGSVSTSLFQLGVRIEGVREIDPKTVFDNGDPTDFHPAKGGRASSRNTPPLR